MSELNNVLGEDTTQYDDMKRNNLRPVPKTEMTLSEKVGKLEQAHRQIKQDIEQQRRSTINRYRTRIAELKNDYEARIENETYKLKQAMNEDLRAIAEECQVELNELSKWLARMP